MPDAQIKLTAKDETGSVFVRFRREMQANDRAINLTSAALGGLTGGLLAGAGAGAFLAFAKQVNYGVDALNDIKDATGASIENISALEDIAARTGTKFDTVGTALVKFNGVLKDLDPDGKAAEIFKRLGLDADALKKIDPAEALRQTAVALAGFANDGDKARIVQELFGKSVREVAPFLKDLSEATVLQGTVTTEAAEQAEKLNQQIFSLQKSALDASRVLVGGFASGMNLLIKLFAEGQKRGDGFLVTLAKQTELYRLFSGKDFVIQDYESQRKQLNLINGELASVGVKEQRRVGLLQQRAAIEASLAKQPLFGTDVRAEEARLLRQGKPKSIGSIPDKPKAGKKGEDPLAIAKREAEELARLMDGLQAKEGGLDASFYKSWEILNREYTKGAINLERLTVLQELLLNQQPGIAANKKAEADAAVAYANVYEDEQAAIAKWLETKAALDAKAVLNAEKYLENIQFETSLIGLNTFEREKAIAAREIEALGIRKGTEAYKEEIKKVKDALDVRNQTQKVQDDFQKTKDSVFNALRGGSAGFKRLIDDAIEQIIRLKIYEPIFNSFFGKKSGGSPFGGAGGGGFGGLFDNFDPFNLISFDGGGSTGNAPRSGGLDGKGGFLAMMHPQERVNDLTKGQGGGVIFSPVNNISITGPDSGELRAYVDRSLQARDRRLARDFEEMGLQG